MVGKVVGKECVLLCRQNQCGFLLNLSKMTRSRRKFFIASGQKLFLLLKNALINIEIRKNVEATHTIDGPVGVSKM